jgi:hypothetical protein
LRKGFVRLAFWCDDVAVGVVVGQSTGARKKPAQQLQFLLPKPRGSSEALCAREHAKQRKKQHLIKRIDDLSRLPRIRQNVEITQKDAVSAISPKSASAIPSIASHLPNQWGTTDSAIQTIVTNSFTRLPCTASPLQSVPFPDFTTSPL